MAIGRNFDYWRDRPLVAYISYENDNPMQYVDDAPDSRHAATVEILSDSSMRLTSLMGFAPSYASYIGVIKEIATRKVVWVNESRPLPS